MVILIDKGIIGCKLTGMKKRLLIIFICLLSIYIIAQKDLPEILVEAQFYTQLENDYIRCDLCPNLCILKDNQRGICRVRQNIKGKLYSLVYNKVIAINVDPIEKKPLYHFFPGSRVLSIATAGCNLNCIFCQNWTISQATPEEAQTYYLPPASIIEMAKENNCESIAFTYTEPTVFYEYMYDIASLAKKEGIKTVWVTCGYINEEPLKKLCSVIDAANIDLKGFSENFYAEYTSGSLDPVLTTLKIVNREGIHFEITNLIIPGANDDIDMIGSMCDWIINNLGTEHPLHFSRFYPNYKLSNRIPTPIAMLDKAAQTAAEKGIKYVYIGNVENKNEDTYCPNCQKLIVDRQGFKIIENNIIDNHCGFCGYEIIGHF